MYDNKEATTNYHHWHQGCTIKWQCINWETVNPPPTFDTLGMIQWILWTLKIPLLDRIWNLSLPFSSSHPLVIINDGPLI